MNSNLNNDFYDRLNMPMILDNDFSCYVRSANTLNTNERSVVLGFGGVNAAS